MGVSEDAGQNNARDKKSGGTYVDDQPFNHDCSLAIMM